MTPSALAILCRCAAGPASPQDFTQVQRPLLPSMQDEGLIAWLEAGWTITEAGRAAIEAAGEYLVVPGEGQWVVGDLNALPSGPLESRAARTKPEGESE